MTEPYCSDTQFINCNNNDEYAIKVLAYVE